MYLFKVTYSEFQSKTYFPAYVIASDPTAAHNKLTEAIKKAREPFETTKRLPLPINISLVASLDKKDQVKWLVM